LKPDRIKTIVSLVAAGALAVGFADWLGAFLEADSCLDAGGAYDRATGTCQIEQPYVALVDRTGLYALWITFISAVVGAGAVSYLVVSRLLRGAVRRRLTSECS
jgi:hypothetical protein